MCLLTWHFTHSSQKAGPPDSAIQVTHHYLNQRDSMRIFILNVVYTLYGSWTLLTGSIAHLNSSHDTIFAWKKIMLQSFGISAVYGADFT